MAVLQTNFLPSTLHLTSTIACCQTCQTHLKWLSKRGHLKHVQTGPNGQVYGTERLLLQRSIGIYGGSVYGHFVAVGWEDQPDQKGEKRMKGKTKRAVLCTPGPLCDGWGLGRGDAL